MSNELALINDIDPAVIFTDPAKLDEILASTLEQAQALVAEVGTDISTERNRANIKSAAFRVAKTRTALFDAAKDLTEGWRDKTKTVNAERTRMEARLKEIEAEIRKPVTDFENKEQERIDALETAINALVSLRNPLPGIEYSAEKILQMVDQAQQLWGRDDWAEFKTRADAEGAATVSFLEDWHARKIKADADALELKRLQEAETARKAEEDRQRIATEAAEQAKAKAQADIDAANAARDKAEKDKAEADQRAQKAQEDAAAQAAAAAAQATKDEQDRVERENKAKADEEARRAADIEHRKKINNEAKDEIRKLMPAPLPSDLSDAFSLLIVSAIAKGQIPNVKIFY